MSRAKRLLDVQHANAIAKETFDLDRPDELRDALQHIKVGIHQNEVSLKQSHQQIAKLEAQPVTNKKEYDALRNEVAAERKKQADAGKETLDTVIIKAVREQATRANLRFE